jgi:hypothetical protein
MTLIDSISLCNLGSLQLAATNTAGNQEIGNVVRVTAGGTLSSIHYRSGGQSSDPGTLTFNLYRGVTLIDTVTASGMTGSNITHTIPLSADVDTVVGEQYTVTVQMPIHGTLYYLLPPSPPWDDAAGLTYIQGRDQLSFVYGYPDDAAAHFFDVDLLHSTDALSSGGIITSDSISTLIDCCAAVLAAVRKTFP